MFGNDQDVKNDAVKLAITNVFMRERLASRSAGRETAYYHPYNLLFTENLVLGSALKDPPKITDGLEGQIPEDLFRDYLGKGQVSANNASASDESKITIKMEYGKTEAYVSKYLVEKFVKGVTRFIGVLRSEPFIMCSHLTLHPGILGGFKNFVFAEENYDKAVEALKALPFKKFAVLETTLFEG